MSNFVAVQYTEMGEMISGQKMIKVSLELLLVAFVCFGAFSYF